MRPRGENVHYDDLLDRHEIVVAAKRKLDAQVVTLAAELAASERYRENLAQGHVDQADRIRSLELALIKIASNGRVPNESRAFDKAEYRAGYVAGFERQADIARAALATTETACVKAGEKPCNEVEKGHGYCDMCASGHYDHCRYVAGESTRSPARAALNRGVAK